MYLTIGNARNSTKQQRNAANKQMRQGTYIRTSRLWTDTGTIGGSQAHNQCSIQYNKHYCVKFTKTYCKQIKQYGYEFITSRFYEGTDTKTTILQYSIYM